MSIKYEIHSICNAEGKGISRDYVRIFDHKAMSDRELAEKIQSSCSLTVGDVRAAMSTIRRYLEEELPRGNRFHIPDVGYFSLAVRANHKREDDDAKVRGSDIAVKTIRFKPDASLLTAVKRGAKFEKATFTSKSATYSEAELERLVRAFLADNPCITRRDMEVEYKLRGAAARKWLALFTERGWLKKGGAGNSPVYFLSAGVSLQAPTSPQANACRSGS